MVIHLNPQVTLRANDRLTVSHDSVSGQPIAIKIDRADGTVEFLAPKCLTCEYSCTSVYAGRWFCARCRAFLTFAPEPMPSSTWSRR
jgi:hypothetical protein